MGWKLIDFPCPCFIQFNSDRSFCAAENSPTSSKVQRSSFLHCLPHHLAIGKVYRSYIPTSTSSMWHLYVPRWDNCNLSCFNFDCVVVVPLIPLSTFTSRGICGDSLCRLLPDSQVRWLIFLVDDTYLLLEIQISSNLELKSYCKKQ